MDDGSTKNRLILVIESDPDQMQLIQQGLQASTTQPEIVAIASPQHALDYLHQRGQYSGANRPDLILLDLQVSGLELLTAIKTHPQLRRIPTIVLTTSATTDDILSTYTLQGNCYVIKSTDPDQLAIIIHSIEKFWLGIVTLPVS